ncbi:hypothetical protein V1514DRAFT_367658 [Lipomyces japonicus]|uniref:uncharacterized protein n=1 Tax=Lipomyces japonicus TaxID=56871 RepID=UPI0034CEBA66
MSDNGEHRDAEINNTDFLLFTFPEEVLRMTLSYLQPSDLLNLRLTCTPLCSFASQNFYWRPFVLKLWKKYSAMSFIFRDNLLDVLSFDKVPTGWFRSHVAVCRVVKLPWLNNKTEMLDRRWSLYMARMSSGQSKPYTATVGFLDNGFVVPFEGIPLLPFTWSMDDKGIIYVSAYPPYQTGRDSSSWKRMMFQRSSYLLAEEPNFPLVISDIHEKLLRELFPSHDVASIKDYDTPRKLLTENAEARLKEYNSKLDVVWKQFEGSERAKKLENEAADLAKSSTLASRAWDGAGKSNKNEGLDPQKSNSDSQPG